MFEVNQDSVHVYHAKQKHITPERLNSPYLLRTMLGFFSRRTRPIRSTENYFAQIWNQRIQALSLQRLYMYVYNRKKSFRGIKDKVIMLL